MLFEQKFYKINVQNNLKILFSICSFLRNRRFLASPDELARLVSAYRKRSISRRRRLKKGDTEGDKK